MAKPSADVLARLQRAVPRCKRCPELRDYCAEVARTKRRAYQDQDYWGKPVPGFGDPAAAIFILGLAPAAHGANRTGRMFTGDRSGDFLYGALHRAGLGNQAESTHRDDGLELRHAYISAACRCAPPANKPTTEQLENCSSYLDEELVAMRRVKVILCLGGIAHQAALRLLTRLGLAVPKPKPKFGHGSQAQVGPYVLLGCYHPSQQNTFTGRLTEPMLDELLAEAKRLAGL